jgi:signal transduction histidine kinase
MWQALDAVANRRPRGNEGGSTNGASAHCPPDDLAAEEFADHLPLLWDALWQAAAGKSASLAGFPHTVPVPRLLAQVRRSFLQLVRSCAERVELNEVLRLLTALEQVEVAFDSDCAKQFAGRLAGPHGLDLVVEIAHDMRSPVTSILFLVDTLRRGQSGPVTKLQERQLRLVYSAAFGLSTMASDVIELAKGRDRLVDAHPTPFSVREIMESVRDILLPLAEEKGLAVHLVPPTRDARSGHPTALSRVLLNLTTNALKFTSAGSVTVTGRALDASRVEFSVEDTGRGIPPEVVGSLFDPFRQRGSGDFVFSSAGLGLSICRKVCTAMGSELAVETQLGAGTRFSFTLDLPPILSD